MRQVHLVEAVKTREWWRKLTDLSATERRTLAGMVWVLVQEGIERRAEDRKRWESLDPTKPQAPVKK